MAAQANPSKDYQGTTLADLPKSSVFTSRLPPDSKFPTPTASHKSPRDELGPRLVKGALYTFVRPDPVETYEPLGVSRRAFRDLGLRDDEEQAEDFRRFVAGKKLDWDEKTEQGVYPWAQCYGGWQFGSWAGQLGDGRAISLFESTNQSTGKRYEVQLKGAGRTPYSRFADGRAVLRSSIREFVVSEALNGLGIPSTRALALTLLPELKIIREKVEPGAIVTRFAESWLRIGTFDLLRARGDRKLVRQLSDFVVEELYHGWKNLPSALEAKAIPFTAAEVTSVTDGVPLKDIQGPDKLEENRYMRLYRAICRANAKTVAAWQAYGFMNGVLNTDNTSLLGLSLDFGPFAFMDNFHPDYTPNHDDISLRYSYKNQPSIIWWNLVRLGETLGELIGAGPWVDDINFVEEGVSEPQTKELIDRAEVLIRRAGEEYKALFLAEYTRLMRRRLGLETEQGKDFEDVFTPLLDIMEACELDFNHFFRRLSTIKLAPGDVLQDSQIQQDLAGVFFHKEGTPVTAGLSDSEARERVGKWLGIWARRVDKDGQQLTPAGDEARQKAMLAVNPKFIPRGWILDEIIRRVGADKDRKVLNRVMRMVEDPFKETWSTDGDDSADETRWCGDVPREKRGMQCSCSS